MGAEVLREAFGKEVEVVIKRGDVAVNRGV